jgi:hypothetical protein
MTDKKFPLVTELNRYTISTDLEIMTYDYRTKVFVNANNKMLGLILDSDDGEAVKTHEALVKLFKSKE